MKLSKCTMGVLVENKEGGIGHVVGLTRNILNRVQINNCVFGEVVPVVKWVDELLPASVHHSNIELFKG